MLTRRLKLSNCKTFVKRFFTSNTENINIAIIGTGPAGCYSAKYLLKEHPSSNITMIDRLPTPYGLVRSGVAPDHPEVKSVTNDFDKVMADERCKFYGNITLGKDISINELKNMFNVIILAYGASSDRELGIKGENLVNVCSARSFVNWYNGHPDFVNQEFDLSGNSAVIVGEDFFLFQVVLIY